MVERNQRLKPLEAVRSHELVSHGMPLSSHKTSDKFYLRRRKTISEAPEKLIVMQRQTSSHTDRPTDSKYQNTFCCPLS